MTQSHHSGPKLTSDLDLRAVRYISGELTPAEIEAFEARLADDQVARESVARAVEIGMAVVQSTPQAQPRPIEVAAPPSTNWTWLAAAVLVIGLGLVWFTRGDGTGNWGTGNWGTGDGGPSAPSVAGDQDLMEGWADFNDLNDSGELLAGSEIEPVFDPLEANLPESSEWMVEVLNR